MTAETIVGAVGKSAEFRTCQYTSLKVDVAAQSLIKANAVAAVVFLLIGGLMGLAVALTRWPAVHLLPAEWFYLVLTGHGANVLLFWIIFFEIAVLYFASAVLLNSRLAAPKFAWLGFVLMIVGALLTNFAVLQGDSSVMFTSYPPMQASPNFNLGLILFAVGALMRSSSVLARQTSVVGVRAPGTAQIAANEKRAKIEVWRMERLELDGEAEYRSLLERHLSTGPILASIDVGGLDPDLMTAVREPHLDGLDWAFLKRSLEQCLPHVDRLLGLDIVGLDPSRDDAHKGAMSRFAETVAPFLRRLTP